MNELDARPESGSAFACQFCGFADPTPGDLKDHLLDEHAVEIASRHWAGHLNKESADGGRR